MLAHLMATLVKLQAFFSQYILQVDMDRCRVDSSTGRKRKEEEGKKSGCFAFFNLWKYQIGLGGGDEEKLVV
jgi:hypothetical protein